MKLRVNPTRMELLKLRKRYEVAVRGHRLLKQKLEGLIKFFQPLVETYMAKRKEMDRALPAVLKRFILAKAASSDVTINAALNACLVKMSLDTSTVSVMNTPIPKFDLKSFSMSPAYSLVDTPPEFDTAATGLGEIFPLILEVAMIEESVRRLALEIERTRRRVNALEYVVIPDLKEAQKMIQTKLDELERGFRVQIMKVKDMIEKEARAAMAAE